MSESTGDRSHFDQTLDSTLHSVDQGEQAVLEAARAVGLDADTQHELGIAARECLVNAVAHGNLYSSRKKIRLRIRSNPRSLTIEIEDEGRGFNPQAIPDPREGENVLRQSGRGLLMIRAYTDEFEISRREPQGTRVRMVKYLRPPPPVAHDS